MRTSQPLFGPLRPVEAHRLRRSVHVRNTPTTATATATEGDDPLAECQRVAACSVLGQCAATLTRVLGGAARKALAIVALRGGGPVRPRVPAGARDHAAAELAAARRTR